MWSGLSAIHASVSQAMSCANLTNMLLSGKAEIKTKSAFTFENKQFDYIFDFSIETDLENVYSIKSR